MKHAKQITTVVQDFDHQGRGVAKVNGKAFFIEGALPGEEIVASITREKTNYGEAKTETVITPHPHRALPECQHAALCGGCALQHLNPQAQIEMKQAILEKQFKHIAGTQPKTWLPPITGDTWGYRRKARLGVKYLSSKGLILGFREKHHKRYITDLNTCEVLDPRLGKNLESLKTYLEKLKLKTQIPQIEIAISDEVVSLILRHLSPLEHEDKQVLMELGHDTQFWIYTQSGGLDTVKRFYPDQDDALLYYHLEPQNIQLRYHPTEFTQINANINQQMVLAALTQLAPTPMDDVLDLFCGIGNFSLPIALSARTVTGIEYEPSMVTRARQNAENNQISNTQFYSADLNRALDNQSWAKRAYHKILLDPPRTGAAAVIEQLPNFKADQIVYTSCNPATLARDTLALMKQGYQLSSARVLDMFPHTAHVEAMATYEK